MRFLYEGKEWVEIDGRCDDRKCPYSVNGHCHIEYWKEYECKEKKKENSHASECSKTDI